MSPMKAVALALVLVGLVTALRVCAQAPISDRFTGWNFAFTGGFTAAALGGLGVLLSAMTG